MRGCQLSPTGCFIIRGDRESDHLSHHPRSVCREGHHLRLRLPAIRIRHEHRLARNVPGHYWRATTQPATTANIAGAGGDAVPVDDYCALPTRITGEIEGDVDLE